MAIILPARKRADPADSPLAKAIFQGFQQGEREQERDKLQQVLFARQEAQAEQQFERQKELKELGFGQQQQIQESQFGQQRSLADRNFQNQRQLQEQRLTLPGQSLEQKAQVIGSVVSETQGLPLKDRFSALLSSGVSLADAVKTVEQLQGVGVDGVGTSTGLSKEASKEFDKTLGKEEAKAAVGFRKKVNEDASIAKTQLKRITSLEKLLDKGLKTGAARSSLEFFNDILSSANIPPLTDASSAGEFKKTTTDLVIKMAKQFGGRITDADLRFVEKNAPSLGKSVQANRGMLKILRRIASGSVDRQKAMNSAVKQFGLTGDISLRTDEILEAKDSSGESVAVSETVDNGAPQENTLDQQTAIGILREAGGDRDKARQIAQQRGFKF